MSRLPRMPLAPLSFQAALVPHAGEQFAGHARRSVFDTLLSRQQASSSPVAGGHQETTILYLATIHKRLTDAEERAASYATIDHCSRSQHDTTDCSWLSYLAAGHRDRHVETDKKHWPRALLSEHSYDWVRDELHNFAHRLPTGDRFNIVVIYPHHLDMVSWAKWIEAVIVKEEAAGNLLFLIGTTDLIHYGPDYHNDFVLPWPQQIAKAQLEADLIEALVQVDLPKLVEALRERPFVADSPMVLQCLLLVLEHLGPIAGKVVDYYDSSGMAKNLSGGELDLYTVSWLKDGAERFVSYVGIVWSTHDHADFDFDFLGQEGTVMSRLDRFDIMQALGLERTVLAFAVKFGKERDARQLLPRWSTWWKGEWEPWGVFVGTTRYGETNCSYGQFPTEPLGASSKSSESSLLATKMVTATKNCVRDASNRWQIPYESPDFDTWNALQFKVELLFPHESWQWIQGPGPILNFVVHMFATRQWKGIQLFVPGVGSATYLPIVAEEWKGGTSNINDAASNYLSSLSKKLGGTAEDWQRHKETRIGIYETTAWFWNDQDGLTSTE